MHKSNQQYWLDKAGTEYQQQQHGRATAGNTSYVEQEQWLTRYFEACAARLGRPINILEFGCGFGRFARLFGSHPDVKYFGYDFSAPMVKPLYDDPPSELAPVEQRVRVAPTASEAFPDTRFDVIFTVSVLIHNSPEMAQQVCGQLASMLEPDGELLLVENALTPISMRENNWHGGCWIHDFVGTTVPDMNIRVYHQCVTNHGIYRITPPSAARVIEIANGPDSRPDVTSLDAIRLLGLPRLAKAVALLESEISAYAPDQGATHDATELGHYLKDDLSRLTNAATEALTLLNAPEQNSNSPSDAATLSTVLVAAAQRASDELQQLTAVQRLRARVTDALVDAQTRTRPAPPPAVAHAAAQPAQKEPAAPPSLFDWDSVQDTQYMNHHEGFGNVCHVFNREWIGIRAAAGALPGHKLAISAKADISARDVVTIAEHLTTNRIDKLIVHGMSEPLYALLRGLAKAGDFKMFLVWHGAPAMWIMEHERKLAGMAIDLVKRGIVRRMNGMRLGAEPLIGPSAYPKLLFNMPPNLPASMIGTEMRARGSDAHASVFVPSWHLLHKNVATCILAAHVSKRVDNIWVLDAAIPNHLGYKDKIRVLGPRHGRAMLETMRQADLLVNVSLIDCHPMVDLEALAVGTPCVRGPLFLDAHEDHPYVQHTQATNPLSVSAISAAIDNVLAVPYQEMRDMMQDYKAAIIETSVTRYRELLEI